MKCELDETVRNYSKLFKGDISRKTNFFKCEEFTSMLPLDMIADDLKSIDLAKENKAIHKSILFKYNQYVDPNQNKKRKEQAVEVLDLNPSNYKKMKMAEKYTKEEEFFQME